MLGGVLGSSPFGLAGMVAGAIDGDKGQAFLDGFGLVGQAVKSATGMGQPSPGPRMAGAAMQPLSSGGVVNMPVGGIKFDMPEGADGKDGNIMGDVSAFVQQAGDLFNSRSAGLEEADRNALLMGLLSKFGNMS